MTHSSKKAAIACQPLVLLLALYLILVPIFLQARGLEEHEVRVAVQTWVRYVTAEAKSDAVIERMQPYKIQAETIAYIAHLLGGGFCICGTDDQVLPVYLFSPKGTYDPQNTNYQYILWEIETRMKNLKTGFEENSPEFQSYQEALSDRESLWRALIAGDDLRMMEQPEGVFAEPTTMILNLTSQWHQGRPYNNECPVLTPPDEHTVTGCVATAMAQIMYYWNWPNSGVGHNDVDYEYRWRTGWDEESLPVNPRPDLGTTYWNWGGGRLEWTSANGGRLRMTGYWDESLYESAQDISGDSEYLDALEELWDRLKESSKNYYANFGATIYDWSIMHDTHPAFSGDGEVAKLCHQVGISIDMNYGIRGSGADDADIDNALEDYFHYDSDAYNSRKDIEEIREEIRWLRPVAFGGFRKTISESRPLGKVGHEWVILGYKLVTNQFYMNMGHGGPPGWYSCDSVYAIDQTQVTHIAPNHLVKFVGANDAGDGSPDEPYRNIEEAIVKALDGATLIFRAGSDNTFFTNSLIINRPFTLKGYDVTIRKH